MKMKMKSRFLICAAFILCLFNGALSQDTDFPTIDDLEVELFKTEVQLTDVEMQITAYATEYYDNTMDRGKLEIVAEGQRLQIFYNNDPSEVYSVNSTTCEVWDADISVYTNYPIFYGWANMDPVVVGPSAALFYAQKNRDKLKFEGQETIRDIPCDKHSLLIYNVVKGNLTDNVTLFYYFAQKDWTTPYDVTFNDKKLRIPIRIHAYGISSQGAESTDQLMVINQINDFAYFKPTVDDLTKFQPPVGIGCSLRAKTNDMPDIPQVFQFSAEAVDIFKADKSAMVDIEFHKIWYDYGIKMARMDIYSKKRIISEIHDFKTGVIYSTLDDRSCKIKPLRNSEFESYDIGIVGRMREPKAVLFLDGEFYDMGEREFRGMTCDSYEGVLKNVHFMDKDLERLVITVYFLKAGTQVGVSGEAESRIPIYMLVTGWDTPTSIAVKMQYNIFEFDDVIFPEMYTSFQIQRCFPNPESKQYFVLILDVSKDVATVMEGQGDLIIAELRNGISKYAQVSEMRIPLLKADYRPSGVFVTGLLLERPPALIQFYPLSDEPEPTTTKDPDLKASISAATLEQCAYACVDEGDFPCKGFFFCGKACFIKSVDPFRDDGGSEKNLGPCINYIRTEGESSNYRDTYLKSAIENLQIAVQKGNLTVEFSIQGGIERVTVRDIMVGGGPDVDAVTGEKPYQQVISYRKINPDDQTTAVVDSTETLADCYKSCKEAGDLCASFSFCPLSPKRDKECLISSKLIIDEKANFGDVIEGRDCFIYHLKFSDYFIPYDGKVVLSGGEDVIKKVESAEVCAQNCRLTKKFKCRGFEYCSDKKTCTLHTKHILDLKLGEVVSSRRSSCTHYAAKYIADYDDLGVVLVEDTSDVRDEITLEECAKVCSEELKDSCKSFNYCPPSFPQAADSSCSLSSKLLRDDKTTTTEKEKCHHYEKKEGINDWKKQTSADSLVTSGYTKKGFTGLVIGMLALGLIIGALGFVGYSYFRSRSSGEGMTVRFMKQET